MTLPSPKERREAWSRFVSAELTKKLPTDLDLGKVFLEGAALVADAMLAEYDKRFKEKG